MATILLVYGSTGGNTEMVAENVAHAAFKKGHKVTVQRAERSKSADLKKYDVCVLASSTYGHGLLQEHMAQFVKGLKDVNLKGRPCAVIGLGDPKYDEQYLIEAAALLEKALQEQGATLLLPALKISRSPVQYLQGAIPKWANQFLKTITNI